MINITDLTLNTCQYIALGRLGRTTLLFPYPMYILVGNKKWRSGNFGGSLMPQTTEISNADSMTYSEGGIKVGTDVWVQALGFSGVNFCPSIRF